jgi:hypothetical protein
MFAHDLYYSQINILGLLSTCIEKTEQSDTTNLQSSIVNIQFRLARVGILNEKESRETRFLKKKHQ